jgi:hypothetical protein
MLMPVVCQPKFSAFAALSFIFLAGMSGAFAAADVDRLSLSSLRVRAEQPEGSDTLVGHGTACAVDLSEYGYVQPRYLLSAFHVYCDGQGRIRPSLKVEVRETGMANWIECRMVAFDKALDVCLLKADRDLPYLARLSTRELGVNDNLLLIGSPRGIPITVYPGRLVEKIYRDNCSRMAVEFDHGDSGAPVFDPVGGGVIGVAVAGIALHGQDMLPNIGLFVPTSAVAGFMNAQRIALPPPAPTVAAAPAPKATPAPAKTLAAAPKTSVAAAPAAKEQFFGPQETPLFLSPRKVPASDVKAKSKPAPTAAAATIAPAKVVSVATAKPKAPAARPIAVPAKTAQAVKAVETQAAFMP